MTNSPRSALTSKARAMISMQNTSC
uniref:Uncharacterized protein n=1 Tax=Arundo donax TaxID=35708 RepID=A0A0A9F7J8_ARUDO